MDTTAYIASGILESYCLGLITETERVEVEQYAKTYPEIMEELTQINDSLEQYALENAMSPKPEVKTRLLLEVYKKQCGAGKKYPPLIRENITADDFKKWIASDISGSCRIDDPAMPYDNLFFLDLPSTEVVTNFMVWAKKGHEEEEHTDYNEFIIILKGHCDMYFGGSIKHYDTGDIIVIPPNIPHSAIITSGEPMVAIVQRQLIAA